MSLVEATPPREALCEWIEPALREIAGQDPLGLQTITTDRILPALLPGVLALSVRARYLSIYSFLVRRYAKGGGRADNAGLDDFMRHREFELCIAAQLCPHCDAESAIGNRVARPLAAKKPDVYPRQLSVKSELGGYGLYYRSPMDELGLIVRRGQGMVGDRPNPVDVLEKTDRAQGLADLFEEAIADTGWYRDWMHGVDPIPAEVLEELAAVACLCRLEDHPDERAAIGRVLLTAATDERAEPAQNRRHAFGLLLDLAATEPRVLVSDASFRNEVITDFLTDPRVTRSAGLARARWAAVAMRECAQDPLSSLWTAFCRGGLAGQSFDGLRNTELDEVVRTRLIGDGRVTLGDTTVGCRPDTPAQTWLTELDSASGAMGWEELRAAARAEGDALTALAVFALLCARVPNEDAVSPAWVQIARVDGDHQPGLARMAALVRRQLSREPTVEQFTRWVIDNFIVSVHETVAMGKLPESTFRFFWEHGRLRFVDNGVWRFDVSGLRREALASLAFDLGWWTTDNGDPVVTEGGRAVVSEVFGA